MSRTLSSFSVVLLLMATAAFAAPAANDSAKPVVAQLVSADGENSEAHLHLNLTRTDITEVVVEVFDAKGTRLAAYTVTPDDPEMSVAFAPAVAKQVQQARVSGFTIGGRKNGEAPAFSVELKSRVPMVNCPAGSCEFSRYDCNLSCWAQNCTEARYSCTDDGGGCYHTCTCLGCPP